jgi:hypothetical protein
MGRLPNPHEIISFCVPTDQRAGSLPAASAGHSVAAVTHAS